TTASIPRLVEPGSVVEDARGGVLQVEAIVAVSEDPIALQDGSGRPLLHRDPIETVVPDDVVPQHRVGLRIEELVIVEAFQADAVPPASAHQVPFDDVTGGP